MTDYGVLGNLLVIFSVSIAVVFIFHQFRLPSIAGFLVAGALIGPHGLNLIGDIGTVQVLAEIGVVLLLFTIGIEFSLVRLGRGLLSHLRLFVFFFAGGDDQVAILVHVTFDGQSGFPLPFGQAVTIARATRPLRLIRASSRSYFEVLRQKLKWHER